ncbi:MAG: ABC transporter ATP-binding protein [Elusimicrobia bacterium]|nr:ABC transporter ATP-binding protein [Elusimicrobiota bacterium]
MGERQPAALSDLPILREIQMVSVERASKIYGEAPGFAALDGVDLAVYKGDFLAIVGPSGSGKSTLLNVIGCIEKLSSGTLRIEGFAVNSLSPDALAELRSAKLGFIYQTFNLIPVLTALENVELPLYRRNVPARERRQRAIQLLRDVGLERFASHTPRMLSGGQRQRVAIARALINRPSLILADEPTANLDRKTGLEIIQLLGNLNRRTGVTIIFSTHDPHIMRQATRVIEIQDGRMPAPGR